MPTIRNNARVTTFEWRGRFNYMNADAGKVLIIEIKDCSFFKRFSLVCLFLIIAYFFMCAGSKKYLGDFSHRIGSYKKRKTATSRRSFTLKALKTLIIYCFGCSISCSTIFFVISIIIFDLLLAIKLSFTKIEIFCCISAER